MDIVDYPFTEPEIYKWLEYGKGPYLPIRIINPEDTNRAERAWGLVDTGSFACQIPSKYADLIGIDLSKGRQAPGRIEVQNSAQVVQLIYGNCVLAIKGNQYRTRQLLALMV